MDDRENEFQGVRRTFSPGNDGNNPPQNGGNSARSQPPRQSRGFSSAEFLENSNSNAPRSNNPQEPLRRQATGSYARGDFRNGTGSTPVMRPGARQGSTGTVQRRNIRFGTQPSDLDTLPGSGQNTGRRSPVGMDGAPPPQSQPQHSRGFTFNPNADFGASPGEFKNSGDFGSQGGGVPPQSSGPVSFGRQLPDYDPGSRTRSLSQSPGQPGDQPRQGVTYRDQSRGAPNDEMFAASPAPEASGRQRMGADSEKGSGLKGTLRSLGSSIGFGGNSGGGSSGGGNSGGGNGGGGNGGGLPPSGKSGRPKKRKSHKGRLKRFVAALGITAVAVACAVYLAMFALNTASDMLGVNKDDINVTFTVPENATLDSVIDELHTAGIVNMPEMFKLYLKFSMKDEIESSPNGCPFPPYTYELNSKMAYNQLSDSLSRQTVVKETVKVTFPEGLTLRQIAVKLEENKVCTVQEFIDETNTGKFGYTFEDKIPDNPLRYHRLEGYIFPDTYQFYVGENVDSVVNKFLNIFNTRVTQDLYDLMDKRGMTLDETLTLASVIQKEVGDLENMYKVSSVLHNRLKSPSFPRLQSDATLLYAEEEIKPYLSTPNQEMLDAYNTYVQQGLPVGPINNPGLDAIKMALDPAETNYYFFLSDQKGEYHYSSTMAQHQRLLENAGEAHGTAIPQASSAAGK